jgi:hypothetical protein
VQDACVHAGLREQSSSLDPGLTPPALGRVAAGPHRTLSAWSGDATGLRCFGDRGDVKVKCPTCGASGTDVEPVPEEHRGPSWTPTRGEEDYAFEVYGHDGARAVRKCINCGAGVYVKLLPPKYKAIPAERWELMQEHFEQQMTELDTRREAMFAELDLERRQQEAAADPSFDSYTDAVLERLNEQWGTDVNPLTREGSEPGDLEQALIRHVVRNSSLAYTMAAMDGGHEPDESVVNSETRALMLLAAGGYLWRDAEREATRFSAPLPAAQSAVDWMTEHPNAADTEPFERLARAVFWTVASLGSLALPPESGLAHGDVSLDVGYDSMATFACDREGLHRNGMVIGEEGMRAAFTSGVALREIEPFFPGS